MTVYTGIRSISPTELNRMKIKGKPRCPYCRKPLTFIYEDVPRGHLNQKCGNCGKPSIVNAETLEVMIIDGAVRF